MKGRLWAAGGLVLGLMSLSHAADTPSGAQIVKQGNGRGAPPCAGCHGAEGMGNAEAGFPRLAGMDAAYLAKLLKDYAAGRCSNPIMQLIAQALNEAEMLAVTQHYARMKPQTSALKIDAQQRELGQRLAERGAWSRGVPACASCHGADGRGVAPHFPPLAGQHATYLAQQIAAWKAGTRRNDALGLMQSVATKLTAAEITAVTLYYASLPAAR